MITKEELIKVLDILDNTYGVNDGGIAWDDEDKEIIAEGIIKQLNPELCPQIMVKEPLTGVTNKIDTSEYEHVHQSIALYGVEFEPSLNHNYYYNNNTRDLILEKAIDVQTRYYYRIDINGYIFDEYYLGFTKDQYGYGMFDVDYNGYPIRDENNIIELDTKLY